MLVVSRIEKPEEFSALRSEWNALALAAPAATVFVTWEWLYSWWEVYGAEAQLHILTVRNERGELVGLAPLMRQRTRAAALPFRTLDFIGAHSVASEYLDFVAAEGQEDAVSRAVFEHLIASGSWDLLRFYQIRADSRAVAVAAGSDLTRPLYRSDVATQPSLYIPLPETWELFLKRLKHNTRNDIGRYRRRLEAKGGYDIVHATDTTALDAFDALHQARMQAAGRVTSLSTEAASRFHRLVAGRFAEQGWLKLMFLRFQGRNVAVLYGYRYKGRFYFYNSGSDPAYREDNVSTIMLSHGIEHCIHEGLVEFDFLGPGDYKTRWGVEERPKLSFAVARSLVPIKALQAWHTARGAVRNGLRGALSPDWHRRLRNQRKSLMQWLGRPLQ